MEFGDRGIRKFLGDLRRRASESLGLRKTQGGAVTFIQRFGDALNLNVHFHMLVLDGVYVRNGDGPPEFHEVLAPEDNEVADLAGLVAGRIQSLLKRRGVETDDSDDNLCSDEPGLAALYASSVRSRIAVGSNTCHRVAKLGDQIDGDTLDVLQSPRCATVDGFSVHANVYIEARDRMRLERLCRYAGRPAVATERLSELPDGRLLYRLKRPWRDGTSAIIFEPDDLVAKLAALVPAPRVHLVRFHGVLAPAAPWRRLITPPLNVDTPKCCSAQAMAEPPDRAIGEAAMESKPHRRPNYSWAELMKRVFAIDVLQCDQCGAQMRILAAIHPPENTRKILDCLGLHSRAPPNLNEIQPL